MRVGSEDKHLLTFELEESRLIPHRCYQRQGTWFTLVDTFLLGTGT